MTAPKPVSFEIKSASLDLLAIHLYTHDIAAIENEFSLRFKGRASTFSHEPTLIDLSAVSHVAEMDLVALRILLSRHGLHAVGLSHPYPERIPHASQAGLAWIDASHQATSPYTQNSTPPQVAAPPPPEPVPEPAPPVAPPSLGKKTMVIDRPIRAGQQVYARDADLVILATVSAGAEVIADRDIHVYAPLRGRALAGARGMMDARIFTQSMEAELVSIAGVYRTLEENLPPSLQGKAAQVFLDDERIVITPLS